MNIRNILKLIPDEIKDRILTVPERLKSLGGLYDQRAITYGDTYAIVGNVMAAIYPNGIVLAKPEHFNRYNLMSQMIVKIIRYSKNIHEGGHSDSLNDLSVYAQMTNEFDEIAMVAVQNQINMNEAELFSQVESLKEENERLKQEVVRAATSPKIKPTPKQRKAS